jgi:nitrogen fixation NifU-like protein
MPNSFYREIINDHNLRPSHKRPLADADLELRGVNPSCGDDITLRLKVSDGIITDGAYTGDGCAISQASADIMLDLIIGKDVGTARRLYDLFSRMITGSVTEEELDELEEAGALIDVSHMPARVKCAVLGWRTMNMLLDDVSPSKT